MKVLYNFQGGADGANPNGGLLADQAGNLYGTTQNGGAANFGTIFKLERGGTESILYSFTDGPDGGHPTGGLIRDSGGNLYGTTLFGGIQGHLGVVFKLEPAGNETPLYSFTGGADGANPLGDLVMDKAGNLYGTAQAGGQVCLGNSSGCGVVFKIAMK
jgi:uncharacterized repeat protein (TIGR03803 family)